MAGVNPATNQWDDNYTAPNPFGFANQNQQPIQQTGMFNPQPLNQANQVGQGGITSTGFSLPQTSPTTNLTTSTTAPSVNNAPFSAFATGTNNVGGGQTVGGAGAGSTNLDTSFFGEGGITGALGLEGLNLENVGTGLQGLGSLAGAWSGFQNAQTAQDSLNFQRDAFNRNFAEQKASQDEYRSDRNAARAAAFS